MKFAIVSALMITLHVPSNDPPKAGFQGNRQIGTTMPPGNAELKMSMPSRTSTLPGHISQAVVKSHVLLMMCLVQVVAVDGSSTPARALLDSTSFIKVTPIWPSERIFDVEAVVLPKVTCDLPVHPVSLDGNWKHLEGLQLADPDFGT